MHACSLQGQVGQGSVPPDLFEGCLSSLQGRLDEVALEDPFQTKAFHDSVIIWESKLRCRGVLQRHGGCVRYSWLLSTACTRNGALPAAKVQPGGQTLAGSLEEHPNSSGHSKQSSIPLSQPRNMGWTHHQQLSFRNGEQGTRHLALA